MKYGKLLWSYVFLKMRYERDMQDCDERYKEWAKLQEMYVRCAAERDLLRAENAELKAQMRKRE